VQSYDGDDWGSPDESDDDSVGPEPPLQPASGHGVQAPAYPPPSVASPAIAAQTGSAPVDHTASAAQQPPVHAAPAATTAPTAAQHEDVTQDSDEGDNKRASISPQLPNMARMSAFGVDLFPGDSSNNGASKLSAAEHTIQEEREPSAADANRGIQSGSPAPQLGALQPPHLFPQPKTGEHDFSSVSEQDETASKDAAAAVSSSADSQRTSAVQEPSQGLALRIDSPPPTAASGSQDAQQPTTATTATDTPVSIIPTEPLQPKKPEHSPSEYEPQPLQHTFTHDNTATSSPVKESDVLSDEIMRSLTPGSNNGASGLKPDPSQTSLTTGSWERSAASSDISGSYQQHEAVAVPVLSIPAQQANITAPVQSHSPIASPSSDPDRDLRRRFSWEALADDATPNPTAPVSATTVAPPAASVAPPAAVPQPSVQSPIQSPIVASQVDERSPSSPYGAPSANPISPTINIVSEGQPLDQQVSAFSPREANLGPAQTQSDFSETQFATGPSTDALSDAPHSSASGNGGSVAPGASSLSEKPTMPFKEIMGLPTAEERIERYQESRSSFATSESGLDEWIATMKNQHPEHANANGSFSGAVPPARTPSPSGSQPSAQQPYYQQYLNASNPNQSAPSSARSRLAGLQEQAQAAAGSAFGHSGNQIGHKGKEFMQSAGKMGKGLFSKGRSKLRGTGDKVFH
jgi:serine/arginine repetitive matrix protein 2